MPQDQIGTVVRSELLDDRSVMLGWIKSQVSSSVIQHTLVVYQDVKELEEECCFETMCSNWKKKGKWKHVVLNIL